MHPIAAVQSDSPYTDLRSDTLVVAVDLLTGQTRGAFVPRSAPGLHPLFVNYACLHPDGERVLLLGAYTYGTFFVVGDLTTGGLLMAYRQPTAAGTIAISNNGKLAAVAEDPSLGFGQGYPAVHIYDLESYDHRGTVDRHQLVYVTGQARFLPGDQRLVVYSSLYPEGSTDGLQIIDVNTVTLERVVDPPFDGAMSGGFGIGPRPAP